LPTPRTPSGGAGHELAENRLTVAAGPAITNDYEGSDHFKITPAAGAIAMLHGHSIAWRGTSIGIDLVPEYRNQSFKFIVAPFVNLNPDRTRTPHDPVVALIPKRKLAVEGGAVVGIARTGILTSRFDSLTVQVAVSHDLGSVHRSFVVTPSVAYITPLSKAVLVAASASVDIVGAGYARYYFGIDSNASRASGLPLYRPGGGLKSANFGLLGAVSLRGDLRKGFAVGVKLSYERLLDQFASSPLVALRGNPNQFSAAMGLAYTF
jgi:outer membrane scaffolding protein for murein synthesis (MipA/OmpV family)